MDEEIFIPLIIFSFILLAMKMILDHQKFKRQTKVGQLPSAQNADRTMGVSELQEMLQESVELAVGPLNQRLGRLEKQLGQAPKQAALPAPDPSDQPSEV